MHPRHHPRHHPSHLRRPRTAVLTLLAVGGLLVAACGDDDTDSESITDIDITDVELEELDPDDLVPTSGSGLSKPAVKVPAEIPSELVITDLEDGTGRAASNGDTVYVNYVGVRSEDGQEFDNNYDSPVPFSVTLGQGGVIQGWETGLVGATAGMRRQLDIPADLAYGDSGAGEIIQPGDALSFVVDIRAVVPAVDASDAPEGLDLETAAGLDEVEIVTVRPGSGPAIAGGETAVVHIELYRGSDLEPLLSTWEFGSPEVIPVIEGATLAGLVNGFTGMTVDEVRIVSIPAEQAWGELGNDMLGVGPDEDIVLVAELVAVL